MKLKLNQFFPDRHRQQVIRRFGDAKLIRHHNGQHELIGGSDADRQAAFEWVSLFAHEIVFTHFYREPDRPRQQRLVVPCFLPAF